MALFGPPNIIKMEAKRDLKGLLKALEYKKDYHVRMAAVDALGRIGDRSAVEPLILMLEDCNSNLREAAVKALVKIDDTNTEEILIDFLKNSVLKDNYELFDALDKINNPCVVEVLIASLKFTDTHARRHAARILGHFRDPRSVESLITAIQDRDERVREVAVDALGRVGDARAIEPLITALHDNDAGVRRAVVDALNRLGWRPGRDENEVFWRVTAEPLVYALEHKYYGKEYQAAVDGLISIGTPVIKPLLVVIGRTDTINVREAAIDVLAKIGTPAVEQLIAALTNVSWSVQEAAVIALGKIGDSRSVEPLLSKFEDSDYGDFSKTIAEALKQCKWKPGKDINGARYWVARGKFDKCEEIGVPALGPLITALQDENYSVVNVLVKIGAPAVAPLISTLDHYNIGVRHAAAHALVAIYHSGQLSDEDKHLILKSRGKIEKIHQDNNSHDDQWRPTCDGGHWDQDQHDDISYSVEFPV